ncbi:MAG: restriction endonuclease subunit S, partial [Bacteroidota bacterium]|nr:restriction endonuclease subunit S [Bacteroidota bacterium]
DALIEKKQRLIELLKEERQALINELVTGKKVWNGHEWVKPAKVKDSGIEWLGEIPEGWQVKKLKYLGKSIGGVTYSPNDIVEKDSPNSTLILRSSNIQNGSLSLKDTVFVNTSIKNSQVLQCGDILLCSRNGSRNLIGKNITIDERVSGQSFGAFMMVFRSKNWEFLSCFFNSQVFQSQSGLFLTSTINQLTAGILNNMYLAIPISEIETSVIAKYISSKGKEIDLLVRKQQKEIQLLREFKTALIHEVVTGKVDVRDEVIPDNY